LIKKYNVNRCSKDFIGNIFVIFILNNKYGGLGVGKYLYGGFWEDMDIVGTSFNFYRVLFR
jgi:hypothetical protein